MDATKIVFKDIGELAGAVTYGHVVVPMSLRTTVQNVISLRRELDRRLEDELSRFNDQPRDQYRDANLLSHVRLTATQLEEVDLLFERVATLQQYFPSDFANLELPDRFAGTFNLTAATQGFMPKEAPARTNRHGRFLPLMPFLPQFISGAFSTATSLFSTINGLYSRNEIKKLRQDIKDLHIEQRRVHQVAVRNTNAIVLLENKLHSLENAVAEALLHNPANAVAQVDMIIKGLHRALDLIVQTVQQAKQNSLATEFLSPGLLEDTFANVKEMALANKCELAIEQASDLQHVEVSYISDKDGTVLLLHVPMIPHDARLRLLRLQPFPIPLGNDTSLMPEVITDVLGISVDGEGYSTELRYPDLLECHKIGRTFYCEKQGVLAKGNPTCLTALHDKNFDRALQLCEMRVTPTQEYVVTMGNNHFLIYSPVSAVATRSCVNAIHDTSVDVPRGITTLVLPPGCRATFGTYKLYADNSVQLESKHYHYQWDWESTIWQLSHHENAATALAESLRHAGPVHLHDVLERAEEIHRELILHQGLTNVESESTSLHSSVDAQRSDAAAARTRNTVIASVAMASVAIPLIAMVFVFLHFRRRLLHFRSHAQTILRMMPDLTKLFPASTASDPSTVYPDLNPIKEDALRLSNFIREHSHRFGKRRLPAPTAPIEL